MIIIECLDGPYAGVKRKFPNDTEISFKDLLDSMVQHHWRWKGDYSKATHQEVFEYFKEDLVHRLILALIQKRPIQFMDQRWQAKEGGDIPELAGKIEDHISESGFNITVVRDDKDGLIIGTMGPEDQN